MKKYNLIQNILIIVVFATIFSCNNNKNTEQGKTEELQDDIVEMREDQINLAAIETGSIELKSMSGTIKTSGKTTVSPQNQAYVCFPMGGFIKNTSLVAGSIVTKGQSLAVIENQEFVDIQQNYLEAKNKFEVAEAEYHRHTELFKDEVYSQKTMQQVTSEYKILKTQVKALEQKLTLIGINPSALKEDNITRYVNVVSPISGYIKSVNINIGKFVNASDVLFEIVNNTNLLLELTLFEKDAGKVSIGQNIRFFINNEAEQHQATIYQTGKSIDTDKTLKLYAKVNSPCDKILSGMYVNAIIETSGNNKVTALPSEAVVSFEDKDYIFAFERNKKEKGQPFTEYRMIQVQKGHSDNGFTEIILPENMDYQKLKVVTKGAYNLLSAKKNAGEMAC
jgi:membrane fusion protein, heavy metal efflux system